MAAKQGRVPLQDIGLDLLRTMPLRSYTPSSSKDDYGKLLIIGGSARLPGAALLSARAALRSGCGTVRVAAPRSVASLLALQVPELMAVPLPETEEGTASEAAYNVLERQFAPCDAVVLGPGLDDSPEVRALCLRVLAECPLPMVVDATALVAIGAQEENQPELGVGRAPRVFTPHDAEMAGLCGGMVPQERVMYARLDFASEWAHSHDATLVLKGQRTLIADAKGATFRNLAGTRGMGTAGSGDVLAGIIGSFLAQRMNPLRSAVWGVHAHALAGERAAAQRGDDGMMASDFLEELPYVLREFREKMGEQLNRRGAEAQRRGRGVKKRGGEVHSPCYPPTKSSLPLRASTTLGKAKSRLRECR